MNNKIITLSYIGKLKQLITTSLLTLAILLLQLAILPSITHATASVYDLSGGTGYVGYDYTAANGTVITSTASSYVSSPNYFLKYLFTGTVGTGATEYWLSSGATTQTLNITFPVQLQLSTVRVYPYTRADSWSRYSIEVSNNFSTWTTITPNECSGYTHCAKGSAGDYYDYSAGNNYYKYVRIVTTFQGGYGNTLNEIQFYAETPPPNPVLSSVVPNSGPVAGGTTVTLNGSNFISGSTVTFGGTSCPVTSFSATAIICTAPAKPVGAVTVVLTNPNSSSSSLTNAYNYYNPPTVSSITPTTGLNNASTSITNITGTYFRSGVSAKLTKSGSPDIALTTTYVNATTLTAVIPSSTYATGKYNLVVTNNDNQSATLTNAFTMSVRPTVSSLSSYEGKMAGGGTITITGTNFMTGESTVKFGSTPASGVTVDSTTQITATIPYITSGTVNVTVTNPGSLTSQETNNYRFFPTPTITTVSPNGSPVSENTNIVITGTNFYQSSVTIGGLDCTNLTTVSETSISCTTPSFDIAADKNVIVTTPTGSATKTGGFSYYYTAPTITTVSPIIGKAIGGDTMTITGTNFQLSGTTNVTFGGVEATNITVNSTTSMTVTTPAKINGGIVDIIITNPDLQNFTKTNAFTYYKAPTLTSATPIYANTIGGSWVTLYGTNFRSGDTIKIGTKSASIYDLRSSSVLVINVPYGLTVGDYVISITSPENQTASLPQDAFTIYPTGPIQVLNPPGIINTKFTLGASETQTVSFNKPLTSLSKTAVEKAISASDSQSLTYTWNNRDTIVTIHAGSSEAVFDNNVYALSLTDVFNTTTNNVLLIYSTPKTYQSEISNTINLTSGITEAVINKSVASTITIPQTTTDPTLNVKPVYINGTATMPAVQIERTTDQGIVRMTIPTGAKISATTAWDGTINISKPLLSTDLQTLIDTSTGGTSSNVVGYSMGKTDNTLIFTKAVRLQFDGMAGKSVGYISNGTFHSIINTCSADTQLMNDSILPAPSLDQNGKLYKGSECKIVSSTNSADLVVWTKHFTEFVSYEGTFPPIISSVNPSTIDIAGGESITITGENFSSTATLNIAGTDLTLNTDYTVDSLTQITVPVTSAHAAGQVDITVTNPNTLTDTLTNGLTYAVPSTAPTITTISPSSGDIAGGTSVTITGTKFVSGATVTFGSNTPAVATFTSSTQLIINTPANAIGAVNVTVTNPDTQFVTKTNAFTYTTTVPGTGTAFATQFISCNDLAGSQSIDVKTSAYPGSNTVAFQTRTTDFYNLTNATLETGEYIQVNISDDRGYDPSTANCGTGHSYTIQSDGLYLSGNPAKQRLGLRIGRAIDLDKFAWNESFGPKSPVNLADVFTSDLNSSSADISTAVQLTHTTESFLGQVTLTLNDNDIEVIKPSDVIPQGNYSSTITITQI